MASGSGSTRSTHVLFPQIDVKVGYIAMHSSSKFILELHIRVATTVRLSDDEGNYFYTPAISTAKYEVKTQTDDISVYLSQTISQFMYGVYRMILEAVPDATLKLVSGETIYTRDPNPISEHERMKVPVPVGHKSKSPRYTEDYFKFEDGDMMTRKEILSMEEVKSRFNITEEEVALLRKK